MSDRTARGSRWPSVPEPSPEPLALLQSVGAIKEIVELLTGQRGSRGVDARFAELEARIANIEARLKAGGL